MAVARLLEWFSQYFELVAGNEALVERNALRAPHGTTLAVLHNANVLRGFGERIDRSRIEPHVTTAQRCYLQLTALQVFLVDAGDFELTAFARLNGFGDFDHVVVVEIQSNHGVVGLGVLGLLFD